MRILATGAHFDDVELGCGGSLMKWKGEGHQIFIYVATHSGYDDPEGRAVRDRDVARTEGVAAAAMLGADLLEGGGPTLKLQFGEALNTDVTLVVSRIEPDLVLTHWSGDVHHDHKALNSSVVHCCRHVQRLLTYRSNWYESGRHFDPRYCVDISKNMQQKIELIERYASENGRTGGKWCDYARVQARTLGLANGVEFAEGFEMLKWLE